jgi:hypothetical protein
LQGHRTSVPVHKGPLRAIESLLFYK